VYFGLYRRGLRENRTKVLQWSDLAPENFATLWLRPKFIRNATRRCQSENGVANYRLCCLRKNFDIARCTLVHKRRKIWPEFRPTQRAVNTHGLRGIATHSSLLFRAHYFDVFMVSISRLVDLCWAVDARDSNAMTLGSGLNVQSRHSCAHVMASAISSTYVIFF